MNRLSQYFSTMPSFNRQQVCDTLYEEASFLIGAATCGSIASRFAGNATTRTGDLELTYFAQAYLFRLYKHVEAKLPEDFRLQRLSKEMTPKACFVAFSHFIALASTYPLCANLTKSVNGYDVSIAEMIKGHAGLAVLGCVGAIALEKAFSALEKHLEEPQDKQEKDSATVKISLS